VAHDFNNVLTAIFGYVDILREELPADSTAQRISRGAEGFGASGIAQPSSFLAFSRQQVLEPVVLDPKRAGRRLREDAATA